MKSFWRAKPRTCLQCGFLSRNDKEVPPKERDYLGQKPSDDDVKLRRTPVEDVTNWHCSRKEWLTYYRHGDSSVEMAYFRITAEVEKDRKKCRYFYRYEPGLSPQAHADRQFENRRDKLQRRIAWIGAVTGSLALLIQFLEWYFKAPGPSR